MIPSGDWQYPQGTPASGKQQDYPWLHTWGSHIGLLLTEWAYTYEKILIPGHET